MSGDLVLAQYGIGQLVPAATSTAAQGRGEVIGLPVLDGLHHDYRRAA